MISTPDIETILASRDASAIQREIDLITEQRQLWDSRLPEIEQAVADNLSGKNTGLQKEYSDLQLKLNASERRLEALHIELENAQSRALIEKHQTLLTQYQDAKETAQSRQTTVDMLRQELENAENSLQLAIRQRDNIARQQHGNEVQIAKALHVDRSHVGVLLRNLR